MDILQSLNNKNNNNKKKAKFFFCCTCNEDKCYESFKGEV